MIWGLGIITFLLTGIVAALIYALRISEKKIEMYETFVLNRRVAYQDLLNRLKELDNKQMFEKDDEVGVIFSEIKDEIEEFDNFIN
jgi:hypothetical protein